MKLFKKKDISPAPDQRSSGAATGRSMAVQFANASLSEQVPGKWGAKLVAAGGGMIKFPDGSAADRFRGQWAAVGNAP